MSHNGMPKSALTSKLQKLAISLRRNPYGDVLSGLTYSGVVVACALLVGVAYERLFQLALVATLMFLVVSIVFLSLAIGRLQARVDDSGNAISMRFGLSDLGWNVPSFFMDGASGSPSLQLLNLKVLLFCNPRSVLELGSGQTTKVLSCFADANPAASVVSLEQNAEWHSRLAPDIKHDYRLLPITDRLVANDASSTSVTAQWYADDPVLKRRYDYILVDGPDDGASNPGRVGIINYLPDLLSEEFIIVFDDAERPGESRTVSLVETILEKSHIPFRSFQKCGIKTQAVICSPRFGFLQYV
jgi:hypothetical protein